MPSGSSFDRDHPRVRGDGEGGVGLRRPVGGSPPRARGRLLPAVARVAGHRITPACAGTASWSRSSSPWARDHPRVRGDGQANEWVDGEALWITPACAGTAAGACDPACDGRGSPPRARGRPTAASSPSARSADHPRVRGDGGPAIIEAAGHTGSPPRARGRRRWRRCRRARRGITPACAGTATRSGVRPSPVRGITPACAGTAPAGVIGGGAFGGSPPRARGRLSQAAVAAVERGITSACAGTAVGTCTSGTTDVGSPPRARGRLECGLLGVGHVGITPACAGTARSRHCRRSPAWDHPRVRGDGCGVSPGRRR